jgi:excisionase family DNA binding protein
MGETWMSVAEASVALGVTPGTVRRWLRDATLEGARFEGRWWAMAPDVDRLVRARLPGRPLTEVLEVSDAPTLKRIP